jgi:hypothetical protein
VLTTRQLNRALLARQLLLRRRRMTVAEAVHAVGGLQSQEPRDPHIALWSRLSGFKSARLQQAAERREVVRGSHWRGTIHTVSAADYLAFRGLLQPLLDKELKHWAGGFTMKALEPALRALIDDQGPLTAQQIAEALARRFPKARPEGLARWARNGLPMAMVPGADRWGYPRPPRFVPADRWLQQPLRDDASPREVVLRCLAAIGPAGAADVRGWCGLGAMKPVLEAMRGELAVFADEQGRELFDLPDAPRPRADTPAPVRFLPEYDNSLLSHDDRRRIVPPEHAPHFSMLRNGRRPRVVLVDGFARAGWDIERQGDTARLLLTLHEPLDKALRDELQAEGEALLRFIEPDASRHLVDLPKR